MVPAVKGLGKQTIQLAHADGKIGFGRLDQQMVVVGHEAIRVADPAVAGYDLAQSLKKQFTVDVVQEDLLPIVTPAGEVIECAWKLHPERSCHGLLVSAPAV